MQKKCSKCKTIKHVSEFHENKSQYDGLAGWCKKCVSENSKTPEAKNRPSARRTWAKKYADHLHLTDQDY